MTHLDKIDCGDNMDNCLWYENTTSVHAPCDPFATLRQRSVHRKCHQRHQHVERGNGFELNNIDVILEELEEIESAFDIANNVVHAVQLSLAGQSLDYDNLIPDSKTIKYLRMMTSF